MTLQEYNATVGSLPVHYWQAGEQHGRAILLIHGGLTDARLSWSEVMPALSDEYRVLAPDLPGFGQSASLPDMRVSAILDWLRDFLHVLGIEQAVIIGSSFGALFARLFAAAYPSCVPAVILVNGGSVPRIPPFVKMLAGLPGIGSLAFGLISRDNSARAGLERMIFVKDALTDELRKMAAANNSTFSHILRMIALHSIPEKRAPLVPTLLLWGENDGQATVKEAERIKASISGARISVIESCGHLPQLEAPEVFTWQVKQFLADLDRPRKSPGAGMLPQSPA